MTVLMAGMFGGAVAFLAHAFLTAPRVGALVQRAGTEAIKRWRAPLAEAEELLRINCPKVAAAQAAVVLMLAAVIMAAFRSALWPAFLPIALVVGYIAPLGTVHRRVDDYRAAVRNDLADAVEFIDLHLSAGYNVPQALAGTADLSAGPLQRELRRVLARVAGCEAPGVALRDFGRRARDVDVTTVANHVGAAWMLATPGEEVFTGLGDTFRRLAEARVVARTRKMPMLFSLLTGLGLLNLILLTGAPTLAWFLATLAQTR